MSGQAQTTFQVKYLPGEVGIHPRHNESLSAIKCKYMLSPTLCLSSKMNLLFSWTKLFHMDIMLAGEDQSQADQPNSLAEGHTETYCSKH
eukprot:1155599-Pelagomonas_calceolata.AAC.8